MHHGRPIHGEAALRETAFAANVAVRINAKARAACEPCVEIYAKAEPRPLLGVFKSSAEAIAFLKGNQP